MGRLDDPRTSADELVARLGLAPHPEGGWYRQTWASPDVVAAHGGQRPAMTSILFLLRPGEVSRWHRVASAEIWLWHGGGPLELTLGGGADRPTPGAVRLLGPDPAAGELPQVVVPAGEWQTAVPRGGRHVLVGCVVAPGFDFADFELLDEPETPA
jgi:predicted cupin superfamily sugar epimerase